MAGGTAQNDASARFSLWGEEQRLHEQRGAAPRAQ